MPSPRPELRLSCAECRRRLGKQAAVYLVDAEWQRRVRATSRRRMPGRIICNACMQAHAMDSPCRTPGGVYVDGHLPVEAPGRTDIDLWSHILSNPTQQAAVMLDPASGVVQGARAWVEHVVAEPRLNEEVRARMLDALAAPPSR